MLYLYSTMIASLWQDTVANHDPYIIDIVGTLVIQLLFWWIPCAAFLSLDVLFPSFSARHKIQPAPKQPTVAQVTDAAVVSLRNQVLVTGLQLSIAFFSIRDNKSPPIRVVETLPPLGEIAAHLVLCLLIREALFYHVHRLFHWPPLYTRIHKIHHRFTAPVALSSQYAHPVEHILANVLPIALPPQILGTHVITSWVFLASQLIETSTVHSGYDFLAGAARKHDRHHERFNVYFGALGLMDYIHGTGETLQVPSKGGRKGD